MRIIKIVPGQWKTNEYFGICASSSVALTTDLADFIENELTDAVATRGYANLVVSGGSTPRPLFEELPQRTLPWNKITITLADERWVDISSYDSNEAMLRETLLCGAASEAAFIPLKNTAESASGGREMYHETLADMSDPFDLVILSNETACDVQETLQKSEFTV